MGKHVHSIDANVLLITQTHNILSCEKKAYTVERGFSFRRWDIFRSL